MGCPESDQGGKKPIHKPRVYFGTPARRNSVDVAMVWNEEWERNLMDLAIEKVKKRVKAKQFQIFDLYVLKAWSIDRVCRSMRVHRAAVYLTKHRVTKLVRNEVRRLEQELEQRAKIQ